MAKDKGKKKKKDDGPFEVAPKPRLAVKFDEEVRKATLEKFATTNVMAAPKLEKITLNVIFSSCGLNGSSPPEATAA